MFSLAVNPIMPLGRDNYLSTLEFLKGVSKSTQAVCLSGDFLFHHLVEMICLLSPVDLLLSSSAAHYCSHKAARSGERQAGRGGRVFFLDLPAVELYPEKMYDTVSHQTLTKQ